MADLVRRFKRMFGISAPRMAVRAHWPWYWRAAFGVVMAAMVLALARFTYDFGRRFAGFDSSEAQSAVTRISDTAVAQAGELAAARSRLAAAERQQQMDAAVIEDLKRQVRALTEESAALKEDLAFFQTLMPAGGKEGEVTVNRFQIKADGIPGEYRYRLLLVQTGQRARDFQGNLQLVVNLQQGGKPEVMTLPVEGEGDRKAFQLSFRFYQRIEGGLRIAPDAVIKSLQVRVFESGSTVPRVVQTATLS